MVSSFIGTTFRAPKTWLKLLKSLVRKSDVTFSSMVSLPFYVMVAIALLIMSWEIKSYDCTSIVSLLSNIGIVTS